MVSHVKIHMIILIDVATKSLKSTDLRDVLRIVTVSFVTWITLGEIMSRAVTIVQALR